MSLINATLKKMPPTKKATIIKYISLCWVPAEPSQPLYLHMAKRHLLETIGRMRTPVRGAFSYRIWHIHCDSMKYDLICFIESQLICRIPYENASCAGVRILPNMVGRIVRVFLCVCVCVCARLKEIPLDRLSTVVSRIISVGLKSSQNGLILHKFSEFVRASAPKVCPWTRYRFPYMKWSAYLVLVN